VNSLSGFFEAWPLFADAVVAGTVAGALLGWLGVYVVLRRMVFMSAALSQSAGLGVAFAFFVALHLGGQEAWPTLWSLLFTGGAALILLVDPRRLRISRDAILGALFLGGAAGTLAVGTRITAELHDIESLLFGSAVAVLPEDRWALTYTTLIILALHLWWIRGFVQSSVDRDGAAVRGLPVAALDAVLLLSIAMGIGLCTRIIGALPAFAFSVLPALASTQLARNVPRAIAIATLLGALSGFVGYLAAYFFDLPVGASQTLVALGIALLSLPLGAALRRAR
jgi:zinc transport system permease protein